MRNNMEGYRASDLLIERGQRLASINVIPVDNHAFDINYPPLVIMAPAGAIDVLMPVSNDANKGRWFIIQNASGNAITLKTSADAAFTTAIVLAANESTLVWCTGNATAALGWAAIGTASSA